MYNLFYVQCYSAKAFLMRGECKVTFSMWTIKERIKLIFALFVRHLTLMITKSAKKIVGKGPKSFLKLPISPKNPFSASLIFQFAFFLSLSFGHLENGLKSFHFSLDCSKAEIVEFR